MICYYNEWDAYAAQWLRNLILAGHLPDGDVDETDVRLVKPSDFKRRKTCHFFAGIGGWPYALKLAGWPDLPVWTASLPCQPFSVAGKQLGDLDERHLWPHFRELVDECRPPVIFGEQVSSPAGREWLAGVRTDLEALGYAVGASDIPAASVGAPHIRQRLYWVAERVDNSAGPRQPSTRQGEQGESEGRWGGLSVGRAVSRLAHAEQRSAERQRLNVAGTQSTDQGREEERQRLWDDAWDGGPTDRLVHTERAEESRFGLDSGPVVSRDQEPNRSCSSTAWEGTIFIRCLDGKTRRIESSIFPLAARLPGDVGRLRAAGNSITAALAAEFVAAYMQVASIGGFQCSK